MNRRSFLISSAALPAFTGLATASAANAQNKVDEFASWGFVGPQDDPVYGPIITGNRAGGSAVGTGDSRNKEVAKAMRLMFDAPLVVFKRATEGDTISLMSGRAKNGEAARKFDLPVKFDAEVPISYAAYFAQLTDKNEQGELYKAEWNGDRANPLIVGFFGMTNTLPSDGDQTSWCAAFVNMCLRAAGKEGTLSALSGSFRKHGTDVTKNPQLGDIVVFEHTGAKGAQGFGHVGFYIAEESETIWVLGGNQRSDAPNRGEVTLVPIPRYGGSLVFNSYRRPSVMQL